MNLFNNIYQNKKIFLTGNTGFKGSWMTYWLQQLEAEITGYALEPNTIPNHFNLLDLKYPTYFNNICDIDTLKKAVKKTSPEIIFHLAAQPLVRYSYSNPIETYQTNIMGTVNILEAARNCDSVKAVVIITTDKCYENTNQIEGYIETDKMGGYDPYSSSKGCAELIVNSYRNSFFNLEQFGKSHRVLVASARAGNVIGGGDWSEDRLIPDIIKSTIQDKKTIIRSPKATRPWQHVLEPLSGYLLLGQKLLEGKTEFAEGWNFGPEEKEVLKVEDILHLSSLNWDKIKYKIEENSHLHEANLLSLNINKAKTKLEWKPIWGNKTSINKTIDWYRDFYTNNKIDTNSNLNEYIKTAKEKKVSWIN